MQLLDLAVDGYNSQQVRDRLHYIDGSRYVRYKFEHIGNKGEPKGEIKVLPGGNITVDITAAVTRTARIDIIDKSGIDWQNDKIKITFMLLMPDGGYATWPLGLFFMPTAPMRRSGGNIIRSLELYDSTIILQGDAVENRYFIPANTRYTDAIRVLLYSAGLQSIILTDSTEILSSDREYEPGTSKSQIIDDLLLALNYTPLVADGNGILRSSKYVKDMERIPAYQYKIGEMSIINQGMSRNLDAFNIPNVFHATMSNPEDVDMAYTYINADPANPLSTISRGGRRVYKKLSFDDIASSNALQMAVMRAADEANRSYETIEFTTALMPHHEAGDCYDIGHPLASGRFIEKSWSMPLTGIGEMTHSAERMVQIK